MPFLVFSNKQQLKYRYRHRDAWILLQPQHGGADRYTGEKIKTTDIRIIIRWQAKASAKKKLWSKKHEYYLFIYLFLPVEGGDMRHLSARSNIRSGSTRTWRAALQRTNLSNITCEGGRWRVGGVGVAAVRKNCPTRRWRRETPGFICASPLLPKAWFMPLRHHSHPINWEPDADDVDINKESWLHVTWTTVKKT